MSTKGNDIFEPQQQEVNYDDISDILQDSQGEVDETLEDIIGLHENTIILNQETNTEPSSSLDGNQSYGRDVLSDVERLQAETILPAYIETKVQDEIGDIGNLRQDVLSAAHKSEVARREANLANQLASENQEEIEDIQDIITKIRQEVDTAENERQNIMESINTLREEIFGTIFRPITLGFAIIAAFLGLKFAFEGSFSAVPSLASSLLSVWVYQNLDEIVANTDND